MPRGDRTGPTGTGARSGRGAGYCAGYDRPGYANAAVFGGAGMGMGRQWRGWGCRPTGGRGWRNRFNTANPPYPHTPFGYPQTDNYPLPEMEKVYLKNRVQTLKAELDAINQRLADMPQEESHDSL